MTKNKSALVVVLGELARSPRMQYHCISLAKNNYNVTVIAYTGDKCCDELESNKNIQKQLMSEPTFFKSKYLPNLLKYLLKPIWQSLQLILNLLLVSFLAKQQHQHVVLVQNPPSIPTLPLLVIYATIARSKLIVDWHNYGYSILSLNLNDQHPFVQISNWIEFFFGRLAHAGFCVSQAMRDDLINQHKITYPITVLYDKPPANFKSLSLRRKHNFYLKMKQIIPEFKAPFDDLPIGDERAPTPSSDKRGSRFTMNDNFDKNVIRFRPNRPAIIMSSTSWTEDEDFGLLLSALKLYDVARCRQLALDGADNQQVDELLTKGGCLLPEIICVITGKGPLKEYYENQISEYNFQNVQFVLPWLPATDYPKMVASCDIGISLHSSSSGVDLPMKVVDMFGCGIPVLAYRYKAIFELVKEKVYGLTFENEGDLFQKLVLLLGDFHRHDTNGPRGTNAESSLLTAFKKNISRHFLLTRWEDNWNKEAKPVVDKLAN